MKRRLIAPALVLVSLLVASAAVAAPKKSPAPKMDSVHGIVKGAVTGKTFEVAKRGGAVKVDAAKAKIRDPKGKFVSFDTICAGTMVTAKGTLGAGGLVAAEVTVFPKKK